MRFSLARLAGRLCQVVLGFVMGWLKHAFSILRIFTDFRMPELPMELLRRGSEGAEPQPSTKRITSGPTQMFAAGRLTQQVGSMDRSTAVACKQGPKPFPTESSAGDAVEN